MTGHGEDPSAIPLVSCLAPTLAVPDRLGALRLSIADYCRQTHPNRELVVVANHGSRADRAAVAAYVASLGRDDIRFVDVPGEPSLGAVRNISVAAARGTVLCQWDDDDRHHPTRIARQLAALLPSGARAVLLQDAMQLRARERLLFWTNWRATEWSGLPSTLMCRAAEIPRYPATGPQANLGEDTAVLRDLLDRGGVAALAGEPHLYIYVAHGGNSWSDQHHLMLSERLAVSRGILARREAALRDGLAAFDFGEYPVVVQGSNGAAFCLEASITGRCDHANTPL